MYNVPCGDDKKWRVNAPTPVSPPINTVYCSSSHPLHSGLGLLTAFLICSNQKIRARLTLPTLDLTIKKIIKISPCQKAKLLIFCSSSQKPCACEKPRGAWAQGWQIPNPWAGLSIPHVFKY